MLYKDSTSVNTPETDLGLNPGFLYDGVGDVYVCW